MSEGVPPLTHTLNLVTLGGRQWIADAGFGGDFTPPLPLAAGETAPAPGGVLFRLIEDERGWVLQRNGGATRSEEHTSELQSLMRISYAVFCLKKKKQTINYKA